MIYVDDEIKFFILREGGGGGVGGFGDGDKIYFVGEEGR